MSRAISKRPDSKDPRNWGYMLEGQRWHDSVQPWNYRIQAGGAWDAFGVPPLSAGVTMEKNGLTNNTDFINWLYGFNLPPVPPLPPVVLYNYNISISIAAEELGWLDDDGNPATFYCAVACYNIANTIFVGHKYLFKPPHDEVFRVDLYDAFGVEHVDFPTGMIFTPVPYQTPTWINPFP